MKIATVQKGICGETGEHIIVISRDEGRELLHALEFASNCQPRKTKLKALLKQCTDELAVF